MEEVEKLLQETGERGGGGWGALVRVEREGWGPSSGKAAFPACPEQLRGVVSLVDKIIELGRAGTDFRDH